MKGDYNMIHIIKDLESKEFKFNSMDEALNLIKVCGGKITNFTDDSIEVENNGEKQNLIYY